jgi:hypothetical protein
MFTGVHLTLVFPKSRDTDVEVEACVMGLASGEAGCGSDEGILVGSVGKST